MPPDGADAGIAPYLRELIGRYDLSRFQTAVDWPTARANGVNFAFIKATEGGDILDPARAKYDLKYYVDRALELKAAGAHVLGLKDMAGLLKPAGARLLIKALKQEVGLPIHFHTHDTSGAGAATILAACDAGVDAVDAAMDAFSGGTSQPCLGSIVEALRHKIGRAHV